MMVAVIIFGVLCSSLSMKLIFLCCFLILSYTQNPPRIPSLPVHVSVRPPWQSFTVSQADPSLLFTNSSPFSISQSLLLIPPVGTDSKPVLHATFGPHSVTQLVSEPLALFPAPLVAYLLSNSVNQKINNKGEEEFQVTVLFHMKGVLSNKTCVTLHAFKQTEEHKACCIAQPPLGLCVVTMGLPKDWFKPDQPVQQHQNQRLRQRHPYKLRSLNRNPAYLRAKPGIFSDMIQLYYSFSGSFTHCKISSLKCLAEKQSQRNLNYIGSVDKKNRNNKPRQDFFCPSELENDELWLNSDVLINYNKGPVRAGQQAGVSLNLRANFSQDFLIVKLKVKKGLLSLQAHPNKNSQLWAVKVEKASSAKHDTVSIICRRAGPVLDRNGTSAMRLVACLLVKGLNKSFDVAITIPVSWWVATMHDKPHGTATTFFSFADREIVGIAPISVSSTIINTAILSSQPVSLPVRVLAVGVDGKLSDITAAVNCQSTNEDIVKMSNDCFAAYVDGSESGVGSTCVEVEFSLGMLRGSLCLAVWTPVVPLQILLSDAVLSPIEGWSYYKDSRCTPVYQRATVQVLAQFGAQSAQGQLTYMLGSPDWFVDVTDLVHDCLRIENSHVAALHEQDYVIGLAPGVTSLNLVSSQWDGVLGTVDVIVTPDPVPPGDLSVYLVSGLGLSIAPSSSNPSVITATVTSHNTLYNHRQEASFSVWLQFGDDTATLLSAFNEFPFFVNLSSLDASVVAITPVPSQRVSAQGDGGGPIVKAELLVSTCMLLSTDIEKDKIKKSVGTMRLAQGSGWVRVNLNTDSWTLESKDSDFQMTDVSETSTKLDTNVYCPIEREKAALQSTKYNDNTPNSIVSLDELERPFLTLNHEKNANDFLSDGERNNSNRNLVLAVGAVLCYVSLSFCS